MPLGVALRGHQNGIDENVENFKSKSDEQVNVRVI